MEAYDTLLTVLYDMELSPEGFTLPKGLASTEVSVAAQQRNTTSEAEQQLAFLNAPQFILHLEEAEGSFQTYGNFEIDADGVYKNMVLLIGEYVPNIASLTTVPMTFADVATICAHRETGIAIATEPNNYVFASAGFVEPIVDAVVRVVFDEARANFYSDARAFTFYPPYDLIVQTFLNEESVFIQSLDVGSLVVADEPATVFHLNIRNDIGITAPELERVKGLFCQLIDPHEGLSIVIHSLGEPEYANPSILRMSANPLDTDFRRLLGD